jgi:hypothetical protein
VVEVFRTQVFERLQQSFADDPNVEVIIDRRRADRRLRRENPSPSSGAAVQIVARDPAMECARLFRHNG